MASDASENTGLSELLAEGVSDHDAFVRRRARLTHLYNQGNIESFLDGVSDRRREMLEQARTQIDEYREPDPDGGDAGDEQSFVRPDGSIEHGAVDAATRHPQAEND